MHNSFMKNGTIEKQEKAAKAIYRGLADEFRGYILKGQWAIGSIIPTESELCERFSASRSTIRKTLEYLSHEGYLERRAGKGTWVVDFESNQEVWTVDNMSPLVPSSGLVKAEVISSETMARDSSDPVLSVFQDNEVIARIKIVRRLEDTPINLAHVHMRKEDAEIVIRAFDSESDIFLYKVLERVTGKTIYAVQDTYEAVLAVGEVAQRLHVLPGSPLIMVSRMVLAAQTYLLETVKLFMRTDIQKINMSLKKNITRNLP